MRAEKWCHASDGHTLSRNDAAHLLRRTGFEGVPGWVGNDSQ